MGNLDNTWRRAKNFGLGRGYKTDKEKKQKKQAKRQAKKDKIFHSAEMPDEELIKRNERRKAAGRAGSRASTVLTGRSEEDRLG